MTTATTTPTSYPQRTVTGPPGQPPAIGPVIALLQTRRTPPIIDRRTVEASAQASMTSRAAPRHAERDTPELDAPEPGAPQLDAPQVQAPDVEGPDLDNAGLDVTGLRVKVTKRGRPVLVRADGTVVDTWRDGYPYRHRLPRDDYERDKRLLQVELLKLQSWIKTTGQKLVVVCEGRDAAGKGGTIKRFTERLNPRGARVVALDKPTDREAGQWYFQRYVAHLPASGEIVLFDRSWYNRAGVERVMGFTTQADYDDFMTQVPLLESMLVSSGFHLVKLWFSVTRAEQRTRFLIRHVDPVRRWKLSPMDLASLHRWDAYTTAKQAMFERTHTPHAPWTVINSNDKERARLEAIRHVLSLFDYPDKDHAIATAPDPFLVGPPSTAA